MDVLMDPILSTIGTIRRLLWNLFSKDLRSPDVKEKNIQRLLALVEKFFEHCSRKQNIAMTGSKIIPQH